MTKQQDHEPKLEVRAEQPYVAIPIQIPMREWAKANALVGEVFEWMNRQGIPFVGPPFFRYRILGDMEKNFDLEIGWPVNKAVAGDGRIIACAMPAGRYATLIHAGHPDRLEQSHQALQNWVSEQNLTLKNSQQGQEEIWGGRFETFLTNPDEQPDPEQWLTEIAYLVEGESAT
jgi:effector-binding domain-containing protein